MSELRGTDSAEEIEHVTLLATERGMYREHSFDEATACFGVGAVADLAQDHGVALHRYFERACQTSSGGSGLRDERPSCSSSLAIRAAYSSTTTINSAIRASSRRQPSHSTNTPMHHRRIHGQRHRHAPRAMGR